MSAPLSGTDGLGSIIDLDLNRCEVVIRIKFRDAMAAIYNYQLLAREITENGFIRLTFPRATS